MNLVVNQSSTLNLTKRDMKTIDVKQGDQNSRTVNFKCMLDGKFYKLDKDEVSVVVKMLTPNKRTLAYWGRIENDGSVTVTFNADMTKDAGRGALEIVIYNGQVNFGSGGTIKSTSSEVLSTTSIGVNVIPSVYDDEELISSQEYSVLNDLILKEEAREAITVELNRVMSANNENYKIAEQARAAAESNRESAETARKNAETGRQNNETTRINSETTRNHSEDTRISSENSRKANEQARQNEEKTRNSNENIRKENETSRQNNETDRASNESDRIKAEKTRDSQESARVQAENSRVTAESSRVSAESSRASEETKRQNAESTRANQEASRVDAEGVRAGAETARVNAEATRVDNEKTRNDNEDTRANNEQTRINQESARVTAENTRKSNEESRISSETARNKEESTRKSQESSRVTAESSRVQAEANRVKVESARVEAEKNRQAEHDNIMSDAEREIDRLHTNEVVVEKTTDTYRVGVTSKDGETTYSPNLVNKMAIGTVTTVAPTEKATATFSGEYGEQVLNLTIPQGQTGQSGVLAASNGFFSLYVDDNGDIYCVTPDSDTSGKCPFTLDANGDLYIEF